jgi:hypothetical protein
MRRLLLDAALLPALSLPFVPAAHGQATCRGNLLTGTVQDSTAAVIPGATLQLDGSQNATSGSDGRFRFACVPPGPHHLAASAAGFATLQQELPAQLPADFHVTLVPSASVTIDVNAESPAVEPVLGGLNGTTLSGTQLTTLADDPDDLQRELQQLAAAAGGPPSGTVISVDGFQDDSPLPPKSSIARIEVNPDLFSAENRQPPFDGGHIQIYTKPGAKTFHGSLFTTNSSQFMNARDPFSDAPAAIGKQRYGFTLTGPVRKQNSNFSLALEHRSIDEFAWSTPSPWTPPPTRPPPSRTFPRRSACGSAARGWTRSSAPGTWGSSAIRRTSITSRTSAWVEPRCSKPATTRRPTIT